MTRKYLDNHLGMENEREPFNLGRMSKGDGFRIHSPEHGCWHSVEQQNQVKKDLHPEVRTLSPKEWTGHRLSSMSWD